MKHLFTRKLMLLAAMLLAGMGSANAFEYGGLTYRVVDNDAKTVKVSYQGSSYKENPYTQASIVIPPTVPFNGDTYTVVEIGEYAFYNASSSSITIDPNVKTVSNEAFGLCNNLTSINLSNVENFGNLIFHDCKNLTTVTMPTTLTSIPDGMFSGCSSMTSFTFPENVSIGGNAFYGTGLTSVPTSCSYIGDGAFSYCQNLTSVTLSSCSYIGSRAFSNCQNLTSVNIYTSGRVAQGAFSYDYNLKDVKLMGSGYLEGSAFDGCNNIESIICLFHQVSDVGISDDVKENAVVIVPESCKDKWKSFMNVQAANINNVGGHVVDVVLNSAGLMGISVNDEWADRMFGSAFIVAPNSDVNVAFSFVSGYGLDKFILNGTDMTSSVVNNKYTIEKISDNQTITANEKMIPTYWMDCSFDATRGSVFVNGSAYVGGGSYPEGKEFSLLIQPNNGYEISTFTINLTDKKSDLINNGNGTYSYNFTLAENTKIDISFEKQWSLTTTITGNGIVAIGGDVAVSGTTKTLAGSMVEVVINAATNNKISSILYNGIEQLPADPNITNTSWTFWPSSDKGDNQTLDVTFTMVNPTISANYDTTKGSVSVAGSQLIPGMPQSFTIGSNVTFTVTPFLGYQIKQVTLDGATDITASVIANSNSYTINNINDSHSIDVMFEAAPTPVSITATIGALGMATLYSPYPLNFSGVVGLKAYIVSVFTPVNNHSVLTPVTNVPAYTGVVLMGDEGSYPIPTTQTQTYVANLLKGVLVDTWMTSYQNGCTNYVLADGNGGIGFYLVDNGGSTLSAGKAYLAIPTNSPSTAPSFISIDLDGMDLTGVNGVENSAADMNGKTIYNLNGQRQKGLKKGINIVGGKKIVVK